LPNVGKSTLFNALLKRAQAQAENRPFTTIEPNIGIVDVPDLRLFRLHEIICSLMQKSNIKNQNDSSKFKNEDQQLQPKIIPATIEFVDIAGLVRGAHRGEGLGNQFLSHIREVDAIVHVVRFFEDENIIHVENNIHPANDFETINIELILADLQTVTKLIANAENQTKNNNQVVVKDAILCLQAYKKIEAALSAQKLASEAELDDEESATAKQDNLLTMKPIIAVANVSEAQLNESDELIDKFFPHPENVLTICAKIEAELVDLDGEDAQLYLQDIGLSEPGLNKLIYIAFETLGLQTFFTAGPIEVRAWTIKNGSTAPQAAGVIHTDFEKGFIKAEIIGYEDYIKYDGEPGAKAAGKLRLEGKEYIIKNGDICHFRFNV